MEGFTQNSPETMLFHVQQMLARFDNALAELQDPDDNGGCDVCADFLLELSEQCRTSQTTCGLLMKLFQMAFSQLQTLEATRELKRWAMDFKEKCKEE